MIQHVTCFIIISQIRVKIHVLYVKEWLWVIHFFAEVRRSMLLVNKHFISILYVNGFGYITMDGVWMSTSLFIIKFDSATKKTVIGDWMFVFDKWSVMISTLDNVIGLMLLLMETTNLSYSCLSFNYEQNHRVPFFPSYRNVCTLLRHAKIWMMSVKKKNDIIELDMGGRIQVFIYYYFS